MALVISVIHRGISVRFMHCLTEGLCDKDGSVTATQPSACAGLAALRSQALWEQENWGQDKTFDFNHSCDAV